MEQTNNVVESRTKIFKIINDYIYYAFDSSSSTLEAGDDLDSSVYFNVKGEALNFLISLEEADEKALTELIFFSVEDDEEEEKKQKEFKEKNGGLFVFRCMASGKVFAYEIQANSLAEAERIGWEKLAQDTRHWKYGSAKSWSVSSWSCE